MTQPTNPSRPSAGAWRAAEKLISSSLVQSQGINSTLRLARKVDTATIIDRETGVAELLEAAKGFMHAPQPVTGEYSQEVKAHNLAWVRLEQAIAKCTRSA